MTTAHAFWIRPCPDLDGDTTNEETARAMADEATLQDAGICCDMTGLFLTREPQAFNFQHRTRQTANISHTAWDDWKFNAWVIFGSVSLVVGFALMLYPWK